MVKEMAAPVPPQGQEYGTQRLLGAIGGLGHVFQSDRGGVADVEFMVQYRLLVQSKKPPDPVHASAVCLLNNCCNTLSKLNYEAI